MTLLDQLIQLDQQLTLWINTAFAGWLDGVWVFLSKMEVWLPFYLLVLVYMFWRLGWKKSMILVVALVAAITLADQASFHLKGFIQRPRPCYNSWMLDGGLNLPIPPKNSPYGFFSSHASNTFAFAIFTLTAFKQNDPAHSYGIWGWIVFTWASLVSLSRIMMGVHFLGDILVGALFGLLVGYALACASHPLLSKVKR